MPDIGWLEPKARLGNHRPDDRLKVGVGLETAIRTDVLRLGLGSDPRDFALWAASRSDIGKAKGFWALVESGRNRGDGNNHLLESRRARSFEGKGGRA